MSKRQNDFREELHQLVRQHLDDPETSTASVLDELELQTEFVRTHLDEHRYASNTGHAGPD